MPAREHLVKKHHTWYVRIKVPARLRKDSPARPPFLVQSLKTHNLAEANLRKLPVIAAFRRLIETWEQGKEGDELASYMAEALDLRKRLERLRAGGDRQEETPYGHIHSELETALDAIRFDAKDLLRKHSSATAERFVGTATGRYSVIQDLFQPWQESDRQHVTNATRDRDRLMVDRFLAWAGKHTLVEDVDRKKAREYVAHVRGLKLSDSSKHSSIQHLAAFWAWLVDRELAKENVWRGHRGPKTSKRGVKVEMAEGGRRQWEDADIVKLLSGSWTPRYHQTLQDLIRLALGTGARLNELCELARDAAELREDGWWLDIREGKTRNAVRQIPVPAWAAHVLERRTEGDDEWLFPGLLPGGRDFRRSWYVSKAFAAYAQHLGFRGSGKVFHTLRSTYADAMEDAGTPVPTLQLLMGHSRKASMGETATYAKGERLKLRAWIDRLAYSGEVMELLKRGG